MATDSATVRGQVAEEVRRGRSPACREGRVAARKPGRLEVSVRSQTGDARPLPARGYQPLVVEGDDGLELLHAVRGDRVWVMEDEDQALVVVAWEPVG